MRVPATTANLGPGFDCLALALDLWNQAEFSLDASHAAAGIHFSCEGEGASRLPVDGRNLLVRAVRRLYAEAGQPAPEGLFIFSRNCIPPGSGLGSSAAAIVAGLAGANALLGSPFGLPRLLELACEMEHHPDNAAGAVLGGLVIVAQDAAGVIARQVSLPPLQVAVTVPEFSLPTHSARAALPRLISRQDAVFNIGRAALVVDALRCGDLALLGRALEDRLHQPFRLGLIPGAAQALQAARQAGAAAAGLSGAGPGLIAFGAGDLAPAANAMEAAFRSAGLPARSWLLSTTVLGVQVEH